MKECTIAKNGRKWNIVQDGTVVYTGKSRVECFRWAYTNGIKITAYQHGGK